MKAIEVLSNAYDDSNFEQYQIERIIDEDLDICKVILKNLRKTPYGVLAVITYRNIEESLVSPLLSWDNLFFCSNCYIVAPNNEYMNTAVQEGKKTAATAYVDYNGFKKLCTTLPVGCHAIPYEANKDNMSMAYVYRDGTLDELFGFDCVQKIYRLHGIDNLDWDFIRDSFHKPLSYFGNSTDCGFCLQNSSKNEHAVLTGLILGYPIESTIALLKSEVKTFPQLWQHPEVSSHFAQSNDPTKDRNGKLWLKSGENIFCDGQQEKQYY